MFSNNLGRRQLEGNLRKRQQYPGQIWDLSQTLCKLKIVAQNRANLYARRRRFSAVPFSVILAATMQHVKVGLPILSSKWTDSWAGITLQSCLLSVHLFVISIMAR